jgi:peptidyl-prolyl cis-trans isomerase SurA
MSSIVLAKAREKKLTEWVQEKIKSTYVKINPKYMAGNDFQYEGWVR